MSDPGATVTIFAATVSIIDRQSASVEVRIADRRYQRIVNHSWPRGNIRNIKSFHQARFGLHAAMKQSQS
jgi:transcriptional regulator of acetoin/glycerol metabolism